MNHTGPCDGCLPVVLFLLHRVPPSYHYASLRIHVIDRRSHRYRMVQLWKSCVRRVSLRGRPLFSAVHHPSYRLYVAWSPSSLEFFVHAHC